MCNELLVHPRYLELESSSMATPTSFISSEKCGWLYSSPFDWFFGDAIPCSLLSRCCGPGRVDVESTSARNCNGGLGLLFSPLLLIPFLRCGWEHAQLV